MDFQCLKDRSFLMIVLDTPPKKYKDHNFQSIKPKLSYQISYCSSKGAFQCIFKWQERVPLSKRAFIPYHYLHLILRFCSPKPKIEISSMISLGMIAIDLAQECFSRLWLLYSAIIFFFIYLSLTIFHFFQPLFSRFR